MENLSFKYVKLAGLTLVVTLAISLGVGKKAAQAQTLFGLAHQGNAGVSTLYTIDTSNGTATDVGPTGFNRCSGMDIDASGTLFATCESADGFDTHVLVTIDPGTGAGVEVGPTGIESLDLGTATDISFRNLDGILFGYFLSSVFASNGLGTFNLVTGEANVQAVANLFEAGYGLAFSPSGTLFLASSVLGAGPFGGNLRTLNPDTGEEKSITELVFSPLAVDRPRINAMDFDPRTGLLFASLNDKLSKTDDPENYLAIVNTTSGDVFIIGRTVDGLDAIAFGPEAAAPQAELSDFKCYDIKGPKRAHFKGLGTHFRGLRAHFRGPKWASGFEGVEVTLADEFAPESTTRVGNAEVFCTAVSKDGAEIADPTASLTCYNIRDVEGGTNEEQDVVVEDEIRGQQALTLRAPKLLCVPSVVSP
jgi:hypothetical protein